MKLRGAAFYLLPRLAIPLPAGTGRGRIGQRDQQDSMTVDLLWCEADHGRQSLDGGQHRDGGSHGD
jgi:hypothetical protein